MPTRRVAVVVPVHNGAPTIAACLERLLALQYPASLYEIIVVENGSTDGTADIVSRYPVRLLRSDPPGASLARQRGIDATDAEIVGFTDADCLVDPEWLTALEAAYEDPDVGGAGGPILAWPSDAPGIPERFAALFPPLVNFVSGSHEFLPHLDRANASYRRSLILAAGGFNPGLCVGEDVELCWRIQIATGARIRAVERAIVHHRHRQTLDALATQYRHYGFGEIILDTLFGDQPGYPRGRMYQARRIAGQLLALPRYALSSATRHTRWAFGWATEFEAAVPDLWLLIESQNILGKLEGIVATRGMRTVRPGLQPPQASRLDRE